MRNRVAGDFDYEIGGAGYAAHRRPDPRIAARILEALGDAQSVINVGAGAGSYEPTDRYVVAIEPSARMRSQRPPAAVPALDATAEALPFDDDSFDAAMATITIHQWSDLERGLREMRRVARGRVVILTFDPDALHRLWLADYVPELYAAERERCEPLDRIVTLLGGRCTVTPVTVQPDCPDGFMEAFYARPERFLDDGVRRAQSGWGFVSPEVEQRVVRQLASDLESGAWRDRFGHFLDMPEFEGALRLIVAEPG